MPYTQNNVLAVTLKGEKIDRLSLELESQHSHIASLQRRAYCEMPSLIAQQQGISPLTFQLMAIESMEQIFDVEIPTAVHQLRRLLYLSERIYNHGIHIHFLAAPDIYGYDTATQMSRHYPEFIQRGMLIQDAGKMMVNLLTQPQMPDKGLRIGGFAIKPNRFMWQRCIEFFQYAYAAAKHLVQWSGELEISHGYQHFMWVSLKDTQYPVNRGKIATSTGQTCQPEDYSAHFQQADILGRNLLFKGKDYLVGPLARMNNNFERLPEEVKQVANEHRLSFPKHNMYSSVQARALECFAAIHESLSILRSGLSKDPLIVPYQVQPGQNHICVEAPRGLTYYYQSVNEYGKITAYQIVPPTRQNQARIEQDLHYSITHYGLDKSERELRKFCERIIRNYDPYLPKNTHFLDLKLTRI